MTRNFIGWFLCKIGEHDWYVHKEINRGTRLVWCQRCDKKWAMNDPTRAMIRYDNDKVFQADMLFIYNDADSLGLLRESDL